MPYPITIGDLVTALIELTNDAKHMCDIAVQTGEVMRARQNAAHLVGQNAHAWREAMRGFVGRRFDEQVDVAANALPQSVAEGSALANWWSAERAAHSEVVKADRAAAHAVEWVQAAEVEYREAADEMGGIKETFDGVREAAAGWTRAAAEAKARGHVPATILCVREIKAGLEGQVPPVGELYETINRRKTTLFDALGEMFPPTHIYAAHPIVAERVNNGVSLCDTFERDLRALVDDAGAAEHG